jgi:hypothetical protein
LKALTTLIATAACFALIVSVANASFDRSLPAKAPHAKVVKKGGKKGHTKIGTKVVKIGKTTKPLKPIIIIGSALPATQIVSSDDCANTGNNCTTEQLCDLWGENCDQLSVAPAPAATADSQDPAASQDPATTQDPATQDPTG